MIGITLKQGSEQGVQKKEPDGMGGCAFFAAVLVVLWGMGIWYQTGSPGWLAASITVAVLTVASAIHSLASGGGKK